MNEQRTPYERQAWSAQISQYERLTGFPNSTEAIKAHFAEVCGEFNKAAQRQVIMQAYCDRWCSVGDQRQTALPGSDLDGLVLLVDSEEDDKEVIAQLNSLLNPHIVADVSFSADICHVEDVQTVLARENMDYKSDSQLYHLLTNRNVYAVIEKIRLGTLVYAGDLTQMKPLISACHEPKFDQLVYPDVVAFDPSKPKDKDAARKKLAEVYPTMSEDLKYFLLQRIDRHALVVSLFKGEPFFDYQFTFEEEQQLYEELYKLGLVRIEMAEDTSALYYYPLWM